MPSLLPRARSASMHRPRDMAACAWGRKEEARPAQVFAVDPDAPTSCPQQWTSTVPIVVAAAASFGAAYFYKIKAEGARKARRLEPWPEIPRPDADPRAYQLALARTRQALDVQRAVAYMKAGEPSRAMVELHRALEENSVCRSPLLDGHQTRADLRDLYKLHLLNTPPPAGFATLLQLRELLGLGVQEAEGIELEVTEAGAAFSI